MEERIRGKKKKKKKRTYFSYRHIHTYTQTYHKRYYRQLRVRILIPMVGAIDMFYLI